MDGRACRGMSSPLFPPVIFRRRPELRAAIYAVAGATVLLGSASAEVIVDDTFEDAGSVENVALIESKATWEVAGNRTLLGVVTDPDGLDSGNALSVGNSLVFARIPATTLEVGSSLVLSMRFRSADENVESLAPFRIGLCENKDDIPDTGDTVGYWLSTGPGAEAKSGISVERNVDSLIGGGNDGTGLGVGFQLGYDWLKPHKLTLKIVRPSAGLIEIHTQLDDGAEVVRTDSEESVTQFNLIALRVANTPQSRVLVDDIKLGLLKAVNP